MSQTQSQSKSKVWDTIWRVLKYILTLGLSHLSEREKKNSSRYILTYFPSHIISLNAVYSRIFI